ncbi:SAM-dependent methyltransferase [Actinomadura madurae]|uniref:SAM-dependent methyltransferase n=1 Tax=Actinomadura madurae TaxID=1993 RepID=UPI0020261639|nr:SAM-dependent methyltransferase [Actinomadura madurae]URN09695.1 SAM-dependent methyltransferase [Actinomadura madurae]
MNDAWAPTGIDTSTPSPARMYDYCLGGKDNFAVDRAAVLGFVTQFNEGLDVTRENRQFLYRVVRYLAEEEGIRQFLDMGSGLPTQANVHQVAQRFQPDAHVVYVDSDPIVLAHGRALLSAESTTVIQADMTDPGDVLAHHDVRRLIDFDRPVAALFLSVAHSIPDDERVRGMFAATADALVPGSFLAMSQFVGADREAADAHTGKATEMGLVWKTRTVEDFRPLVPDLEPVPPGLVDVADWRPDPDQPPPATVDAPSSRSSARAARTSRSRSSAASSARTDVLRKS